ncbi:MAG: hypothetical protein AABY83_02680 [Pseudomonadota bacterium]
MKKLRGTLILAILSASLSAQAAPPTYNIISNAAPEAMVVQNYEPGGDSTGVRTFLFPSFNDYGDVGGRILPPAGTDPRYSSYPAIWRDGVLQTIDVLGCESTVTYCASRVSGINNYGIAAATSNALKYPSPWGMTPLAPYYQHEAIVVNGRMSVIKGSGSEFGWTSDINDNGRVAGGGRSSEYVMNGGDYSNHGFVWVNDNYHFIIGDLWQQSIANAINNANQVTGVMDFDKNGKMRAFLWQDGAAKDLGSLGGGTSEGWDINDAASPQVVGDSITTGGKRHAFLWQSDAMRDLGTLGGDLSVARAINKAGSVVGYSSLSNGAIHGFIWSSGVMYDLNNYLPSNSGWVVVDAYAINKHGEILVRAQSNTGDKYIVLSPPDTVHDARPAVTNTPPGVVHESAALYGGTKWEGAYVTATDNQGNNYSAGYFYSSPIDFNVGAGQDLKSLSSSYANRANEYAREVFVSKNLADGSYGWTVLIGNGSYYSRTYITKMVTDKNGNLYVAGWFDGDEATYFGAPDGTRTKLANYSISSDTTRSFVTKYSPDGIVLWTTMIAAPTGIGVGGLALDGSGNVMVSGAYYAYNAQSYNYDYRDIFILQGPGTVYTTATAPQMRGVDGCNGVLITLTANGAFSNAKMISPAQADSGCVNTLDVAVASTGEIFMSGFYTGRVDMDPGAGTDVRKQTGGVGEYFLTKLLATGAYSWTNTHVRTDYRDVTGVAPDTNGGAYWFDANVYDRAKLRRVDSAGVTLWERSVIGDYFSQYSGNRSKFFADSRGNVYISGAALNAKNFNTAGGVDYQSVGAGTFGFITKWTGDGSYGWTMATNASPFDLTVDEGGHMTVIGEAYLTLDYDPADNIPALQPAGGTDAFRMTFWTTR